MEINQNIDLMLEERGISNKALIADLGISKSTYYAKKSGKFPWFLDEAAAIARFFGVSIDRLCGMGL